MVSPTASTGKSDILKLPSITKHSKKMKKIEIPKLKIAEENPKFETLGSKKHINIISQIKLQKQASIKKKLENTLQTCEGNSYDFSPKLEGQFIFRAVVTNK